MMDIEKLIEQMRYYGGELGATPLNNVIGKYMLQAADALAELRGEVESLKNGHCTGCSVPVIKTEQLKDLNDAPELRSENEKLRAALEQVKAKRDAAISDLTYIARTYPVDLCDDLVCQYCKHYPNVNTRCPGWTEDDCFEWSGQKED